GRGARQEAVATATAARAELAGRTAERDGLTAELAAAREAAASVEARLAELTVRLRSVEATGTWPSGGPRSSPTRSATSPAPWPGSAPANRTTPDTRPRDLSGTRRHRPGK
ncbi:hypothetical protein JNW87_26945, partial [Micromonospora sp. ATA51]|nr:hypothetical protein [Micromonospora sp. ATA51]